MNTIKVRITIYHTIYSADNSHIESSQQLLTEIQAIELTDEQLQYLQEHDGMVEDNTPANFKDLRQDFQEIALRLSQSSMEYLHSDEMLGADIPLDYEVCYDSGVPLRSKYWIEDGILYCHENSGLIVVVHCMDDKRESFSCDFAHEIGGSAFSDCRHLKEVHLPNTLEIAPYAFAGCTNLQNVELCKEQITIMENAFAGCVMLRELHLPSEEVMISREAFRHCINLTRLFFGDKCFTPDDAPKNKHEQFILKCKLCIHGMISERAFAYTPLAYLSDSNADDEDDDDLDIEFDDDLDFSDLFNFDKSKEKDVSEELQGNMLAAFHGVTHHNVYAEIPFMLHAGLTSSAEALLRKMAVDTLEFTTDGGKRIIVAKIPELTSEAGFVARILALTFEGNAGKYYIVELDDDQYFLDQMEHGCHKTFGVRWTDPPTLQQVAEKIIGLNG